ncbi:hypothetical protein D3C81_772110 [compost metagenome]
MENKQVNKRSLATWMEDFIIGLSKKAEVVEPTMPEEEVVEAGVNVNDLDRVVWKDETFRVSFDDKGANVINEFGNIVTAVPGAKTVEEVDHKLNSNEIVASELNTEDEIAIELDKIATSLEEEACDAVETEKETKEAELVEDPIVTPPVDPGADPNVVDDSVLNVIATGFEEIEAKIANLEKQLSMFEQQYARNPQLEDVSTTAPEDEIKHFTESADASAQELSREQGVDITSPAGRIELSQQTPSPIEQAVTETEVPSDSEEVENTENDEIDLEKPPIEEEVTEEVEEDTTPEEENDDFSEEKIEKLNGVAQKIFQKGICPDTGEELVKSTTAGNFLGVYSPKGGTEYAVDLRNGDIFKYKK